MAAWGAIWRWQIEASGEPAEVCGSFGTQVEGQSGLYKERIVYLGQEIDDLVINQIISVMLFADAEDATKEQYLYINSPGGSVIAGLALYDTFG
jgi:ATP-dependent Clp endopeptidase proteolytic subunit ClpP